jgi:hypothetical protein
VQTRDRRQHGGGKSNSVRQAARKQGTGSRLFQGSEGALRILLLGCLTDVVLRVGEREVDLVLMCVHLGALEQRQAEAGRAKGQAAVSGSNREAELASGCCITIRTLCESS